MDTRSGAAAACCEILLEVRDLGGCEAGVAVELEAGGRRVGDAAADELCVGF
jgi:hypothetical protein